MPRAAIATEAADVVLPLKPLAARLVELVRVKQHTPVAGQSEDDEGAVRRILAHLRVRTGHDFTHYKRSTILRRISRRMQVTRKETFEDYFLALRENPDEAQALLADLLISVTTFFRDSRSFEALARLAIPHLFDNKDATQGIRVWVAGCATGEEAYSIAMLLLEEAGRRDVRPEIQIFATDMDTRALTIAREGCYPAVIEADVSEDRLRRFFNRDGDDYRVKRELRDLVLFANHSLLRDPPFSRADMISCRNLLIYLNRDLQQQVLATLNYALTRDGYLFLGSSETADHPDHLFRVVDRDARIYQSSGRAEKPPMLPRLLGLTNFGERLSGDHGSAAAARTTRNLHREALEESAPPSIVVDDNYRVLHLSESAGRYLKLPGGVFTADVTELVRDEVKFELRSALHRAFERGESTLSSVLMVRFNGTPHRLYFQVKPAGARESGNAPSRALILFIEGEAVDQTAAADTAESRHAAEGEKIGHLQQELELAHARLRTMREESEAANEELRAANEELQSINEEYRSTAEELETSKEELQSINEELQTVNSELKLKLDTVSRANSDLQNLMAATDFGTLFLDAGLRIKRFTPRLTDLFNVTSTDVGRPITDFTHQLQYEGLAEDARTVLQDLAAIEREVKSRKGGWYLVRLRPYRTVDDKIDGIVVTFMEVTERRRMEDALRTSEARLRMLLGELNHRVKNILAVVQAMVHQTARHSAAKEDLIARLEGRLLALANSHNLLVDTDWRSADLRSLVESELGPYAADSSRLKVSGSSVALPPDVATPFALVLHELATNAIKYGALANDTGCVEVAWQVDSREKTPKLRFHWKESGGPFVKAPVSAGFGSNMIHEGLPKAKVEHRFPPAGAECDIELPLPAAASEKRTP